jgi:hypothetical protein
VTLSSVDGRISFHNVFWYLTQCFSAADHLEKDGYDAGEDDEKSMWDTLVNGPQEALDMIMDPNKKERQEEEKTRQEVKAAKKTWRAIRKERFAFLDHGANDEKKMSG